MPTHAGGRAAGRSAPALEARRLIDAFATREPSWRDLSFADLAQRTGVQDLIDLGKLSGRTAQSVLNDARRERDD
jgi:hypothetical protein